MKSIPELIDMKERLTHGLAGIKAAEARDLGVGSVAPSFGGASGARKPGVRAQSGFAPS